MRVRSVVPALSLLVAALAVLWPSGPAAAGGPTSVLLSWPGEGRTAALYFTDAEYTELARAVGAEGAPVDPVDARQELGTPVTLTWLIHDVTPWRVDFVYVHDDGTAWVATQESLGGGSLDAEPVVWHRGGARLAPLLDRLLPLGDGASLSTVAPAPEPATAAQTTAPATAEAAAGSPVLVVGVGLAGLALGVAATLTALVVRRPQEKQTPTDDSASVGEQLVWP